MVKSISSSIKSNNSDTDPAAASEFNEFLRQYKINYINNSFQPIKFDDDVDHRHHHLHLGEILNDSNYDNYENDDDDAEAEADQQHIEAFVNTDDLEADNEVCINLRNFLLASSSSADNTADQNQAVLNLTRTISNASVDRRNERSKAKLTSNKANSGRKAIAAPADAKVNKTTSTSTNTQRTNVTTAKTVRNKKSSSAKTATVNLSTEKNAESKTRAPKSVVTSDKSSGGSKPLASQRVNETLKPVKATTKKSKPSSTAINAKTVEEKPVRSKSSPSQKATGERTADKKRNVDGRKASLSTNSKSNPINLKTRRNSQDKMLMPPKVTTHHLSMTKEHKPLVAAVNTGEGSTDANNNNNTSLNSKSTSSTSSAVSGPASSSSSGSSGQPRSSLGLTKLSFQLKLTSGSNKQLDTSQQQSINNASSIIISTSPVPLPNAASSSSDSTGE